MGGGMGLYHGVDHYEQMKISDKSWTEPFVKGWPDLLQSQTVFRFAWSYIIAWVGVGMCLGSCVLFFMASMCIRSDKRREEAMNMQYLMPESSRVPEFLVFGFWKLHVITSAFAGL